MEIQIAPAKPVADSTHATALASLFTLFNISSAEVIHKEWSAKNLDIWFYSKERAISGSDTFSIPANVESEMKRLARPFFSAAFNKTLKSISPDTDEWDGSISIDASTGDLDVSLSYSYESQEPSSPSVTISPDDAAFTFIKENKIAAFTLGYYGSGDSGGIESYEARGNDGELIAESVTKELIEMLENEVYYHANFDNEGSSGEGECLCRENEEGNIILELSHLEYSTDSETFHIYYPIEEPVQ